MTDQPPCDWLFLTDQLTAADVKVSLKICVIKLPHAQWIVDLYNTLKDDKEMAINDFRSAGITEAIENAIDRVKKPWELFQRSLIVKDVFSINIWSNGMTHFSFLFKFHFFNHHSLPNATQPDYGIINLIIFFLRFPLFRFYSKEKITDKNFWSILILAR